MKISSCNIAFMMPYKYTVFISINYTVLIYYLDTDAVFKKCRSRAITIDHLDLPSFQKYLALMCIWMLHWHNQSIRHVDFMMGISWILILKQNMLPFIKYWLLDISRLYVGDSGAGKTTLAMNICKQWAEGNLLT